MLLPASPGSQCSAGQALEAWCIPLPNLVPLSFRLEAGASPAIPAQYPAHIRMLNLVQLSWHHCGTFEVTVTTAKISSLRWPQFLFLETLGLDMRSQSQEEDPDCAAPGCLQFPGSCPFWSPGPVSPGTFPSIWRVPPEGAASHGCGPPNPPRAGIPPISSGMCWKGLQKNPLAWPDDQSGFC